MGQFFGANGKLSLEQAMRYASSTGALPKESVTNVAGRFPEGGSGFVNPGPDAHRNNSTSVDLSDKLTPAPGTRDAGKLTGAAVPTRPETLSSPAWRSGLPSGHIDIATDVGIEYLWRSDTSTAERQLGTTTRFELLGENPGVLRLRAYGSVVDVNPDGTFHLEARDGGANGGYTRNSVSGSIKQGPNGPTIVITSWESEQKMYRKDGSIFASDRGTLRNGPAIARLGE